MRKSCWARSLAAVVFVGALFFGFAEAEAVQLEDGTVIDYDITGLANVEVGQDSPDVVPATVDFMPGAITQGTINVGNNGTVNVYGGQFDYDRVGFGDGFDGWAEISLAADADVTFYGTSFTVGGEVIAEGTESVDVRTYPVGPWSAYSVSWTDADENVYDIWVLVDAFAGTLINFSQPGDPEPDPEPEINVDVNGLVYDFGDVAIGDLTTVIVPIYNYGDGDLTVSSVLLYGSYDFYVTDSSEIPFTIAAGDPNGVDIEVTFAPSEEGMLFAALSIVNNDSDEGVINVVLTGLGTVDVVPPEQQIQDILDFYDDSVANETLVGNSPRRCFYGQYRAALRLRALRCMIKSAGDLINAGAYDLAVRQLKSVAKKTDGQRRPMDFVVGDSVETLNAMVDQLIADLTL